MPDADLPTAPPARRVSAPWYELPLLVLVALGLALILKTFFVQAFYIPSASMENTLQGGNPTCSGCGASPGHPFDRVLVNKLVYDFRSPRRGEIVVFKGPPRWPDESDYTAPTNPVSKLLHHLTSAVGLAPSGGSDFIKRVIGVGGDTITCQHDVLRVNGHVLNEPFLYPGSHPCSGDDFEGRTVHVPPGDIWVMGDHRDESSDSRVNGPVPVSDVIGRAFVVIWPFSDWKTLPIPATFKQAGLATAGGRAPLVLLAVGVLLVVAAVLFVVVRRRRRAPPSYAAGNDRAT
jgi:signal peptidase I